MIWFECVCVKKAGNVDVFTLYWMAFFRRERRTRPITCLELHHLHIFANFALIFFGGAHLQYVCNHSAKFESWIIHTFWVSDYTNSVWQMDGRSRAATRPAVTDCDKGKNLQKRTSRYIYVVYMLLFCTCYYFVQVITCTEIFYKLLIMLYCLGVRWHC